MRRLNWGNKIVYPDMYSLETIGDGSCLFHAVVQSFYKDYISMGTSERMRYISDLRRDLSERLVQKIEGKSVYESLSRGQLREISESVKEVSLEYMQKELNSCRSVSNVYNELLSNEIERDIYLLDAKNQDIYPTGDMELLIRRRKSIVVLYLGGHYETVGVKEDCKIVTHFHHKHPFIRLLRHRWRQLCKV